MAAFQRWDPRRFLDLMHETVPDYERLQGEAVQATGTGARRILELGIGTGETARRLLHRHPDARLTGIDVSDEMLSHARARLPPARVQLHKSRLEDELPLGHFDVIVSVLAVHHLTAAGKQDLFRRASARVGTGGRVVIGDFVVPSDPSASATLLDPDFDRPSGAAEQIEWLRLAGLRAELTWSRRDLAVLVGHAT